MTLVLGLSRLSHHLRSLARDAYRAEDSVSNWGAPLLRGGLGAN